MTDRRPGHDAISRACGDVRGGTTAKAGNGRVRSALAGIGLGAVLLIAAAAIAAQSGATVDALLRQTLAFSADDIRAFEGGSAVIRSVDTPVRQELAHVAAVYIEAPIEYVIERFRDIEQFERSPGIPRIGLFSHPPRLEDLESLTLPAADIAALRTCRPGACAVKLSAAAMRRFQHDVDWSSPDAAHEVNAIARAMILELVRAYQHVGNAALGSYDDGPEPLSVAEQFRALLASRDPLPDPVAPLLAYLDDYPRGRPPGVEEFFYWAVVDFGLKPTLRVNHVTIYPLAIDPPSGVSHVLAIKQLYASHYFHTTLELRFLIRDDRRDGRSGTSLISITRSRSDGMTGFKGLLRRPVISRRSRAAVRGYLEHMKRQVERPAPAAVDAPPTSDTTRSVSAWTVDAPPGPEYGSAHSGLRTTGEATAASK